MQRSKHQPQLTWAMITQTMYFIWFEIDLYEIDPTTYASNWMILKNPTKNMYLQLGDMASSAIVI